MNSFTKVAKAAIVGIVLSGSLLSMTACDNNSQPAASAPTSPVASPSDTATPVATAAATTAPDGPMGVDIDDVMANRIDSGVYKTFPNETPASLKEGVTFALSTYEHLVNIQNFYQKRTGSDNARLLPDAAKFDQTYLNELNARTDAHNGQIKDILSFRQNGGLGKDDSGVEHYIKDGATVRFVSGQPNVEAGGPPKVEADGTPKKGNVIVIKGTATLTAPTSDNKVATETPDYWISITPTGKGTWLVSGMGFKTQSSTTFTDSVPAPEAPNGK